MMHKTLVREAVAAILLIVPALRASADDRCFRQPSQVENLENTSEHLILRSRRSNYLLEDSCIVIERRTFGKTLDFAIRNRFPADTQVSTAYLFIKSDRTLATEPPVKVSLSRSDGWFLELGKGRKPSPGDRMNFEPYQGSVKDWNTAHATPGDPAAIDERLRTDWHAFATDAPSMPSTVPIDYWQITEPFDITHDVRTNYLVRFAVNTGSGNSMVPFQVYIQPAVKSVQLTIFSNIDELSGTYKFIIK